MKLNIILYLVIRLVVEVQIVNASDDGPVVVTSVGTIRGVRASDGNYSMFKGIPYAKVNAANPFGPSLPYPKFEEYFDATTDSKPCPQIEEYNNTIVGSLDCLNLNVYVPDSTSVRNTSAVLVYIHGGSYAVGFASTFIQGPKFLVRHDVILVTLNYRLGPYGFMCLHTPSVPGNQGLKDQLAALRWVKGNIAAFGGDVNRITLFGESAGGIAIDLHVISEQEQLYNGIIMQSGSSFNPVTMRTPDTRAPVTIASKLGFQTEDVDEALNYISNVDPHVLIDTAFDKTDIVFRPCVEKVLDNVEILVRDYSINVDAVPKAKKLSVLLGFTSDELIASISSVPSTILQLKEIINNRLSVAFTFDDEMLEETTRIIHNFYAANEKFRQEIIKMVSDFASDFQYVNPTQRCLRNYIKNGAKEVFYYAFSYNGNRNFGKRLIGIDIDGVAHADELGYLFDMEIFPEEPKEEDQIMIDRMTTMWTNFAKYGNPTPESIALLPVKWIPVTKDSEQHFMNITLDMDVGRRPFQQRLAFWNLFYQAYGEYEVFYNKNRSSFGLSLNGNIWSRVFFVFLGLLSILVCNSFTGFDNVFHYG